jgi:tetratricopeptide (TPR) repeat protein
MCFFRLERPTDAIKDTEKALVFNPESVQAIVAKGEALYNMGQFEKALVQFHKGWRVRNDPDIKKGMFKCRDAIMNILGDTDKIYETELVEKVIKQMENLKVDKGLEIRKRRSKKQKQKNRIDPGKHLLGKMNEDVKFLENFINFKNSQPTRTEFTVSKIIKFIMK